MVTQEKSLPQAPQVWDKPTAQARTGDYIRVPFAPVMQVVERDVLEDSQVWLLVKSSTGSYSEEWVVKPESPQETQQQPSSQPQPVELAEDEVSCESQPTQGAQAEFERGCIHGQVDASERLHPIYTEAICSYSTGYLEGYNSVLNPTIQQTAVVKQAEWSASFNSRWCWYESWVGDRCIGHSTDYQAAERKATQYIAVNEMIKRQNAKGSLARERPPHRTDLACRTLSPSKHTTYGTKD